jgi:hypothetical protein
MMMGDRSGIWNTRFWPTYNAADSQRTFLWILPYLVLPCATFHSEKLTTVKPVSKFPASHGTQRFITVFTTICHKILFWARWNRYTSPNLISVTFLLILLPQLYHILLCGSTELFYTVITSMHATCPHVLYPSWCNKHNNDLWWVQNEVSPSTCYFFSLLSKY